MTLGVVAATDGVDGAPEASHATTPGSAPSRLEPGASITMTNEQCKVIGQLTIVMVECERPERAMPARLELLALCQRCRHLEECYPPNEGVNACEIPTRSDVT